MERRKRLKVLKALSRKEFGRPGQGRKTSYVDRKKRAQKEACRTTKGRTRDEEG